MSLDVADHGTIEETTKSLREKLGDSGLQGLVNNAGVSVQAPLEYVLLEQFRRQLEVNVTGQLAVTQAMLPLVRPDEDASP